MKVLVLGQIFPGKTHRGQSYLFSRKICIYVQKDSQTFYKLHEITNFTSKPHYFEDLTIKNFMERWEKKAKSLSKILGFEIPTDIDNSRAPEFFENKYEIREWSVK
jgi:hypothetical protein